ncbi:MAG: murein biosynthesis integral membrane protein MurJ [bacterium]
MVSRFFKLLNRQSHGINEAALLLGLFTFVSQLLGLVRDRLLATYLGAGAHLDLYYAAFKIPDFLYVSVATLAAITVLLPYLTQKYGEGDAQGRDNAQQFLNQIFTVLLGFLVLLSVILFIAMPWLAKLVAPGFSASELSTLVGLSRIMLLQPIIVGVSNMISSVTQMFKKFFVAALSPVFYNVGIILGIVLLYPTFGITGLAYGVILGAVLHLVIQIPVLIHHKLIPQVTTRISFSEIKSIVVTSIPRTIGLSMSSFTALILTSIASTLATGSISLFNLTNNMLNVPIGIVGISYSVASFPTLVKFFQNNEHSQFASHILNATRKIIFWSVPIMVLFIILRAQVVRVILGSQSFSWNDTKLAAASLAILMLGLVCQSLVHLFVRGYYAMGNTKKPLIMNFAGEVITIILAIIFIWLFRHSNWFGSFWSDLLRLDGVADISLLALPLAYSIGNIFNYFALWWVFKKDFPQAELFPVIRTFAQTATASLCMGAVTYGALNIFVLLIKQNTFWGIFMQGFLSGMLGISIFVAVLVMLRNHEIDEFIATLKKKFWKANVVQEIEG